MTDIKTMRAALNAIADELQDIGGLVQAQCIRDALKLLEQQQGRLSELEDRSLLGSKVLNDVIVGNQAAWIEWQHGQGAESAMRWIHNGLCGPGHIPDEDAPYGKEPQAWYDANISDPRPPFVCGNP